MTVQTLESLNNRYQQLPYFILLKGCARLYLLVNFSEEISIVGKLHDRASNILYGHTTRIYSLRRKKPVCSR